MQSRLHIPDGPGYKRALWSAEMWVTLSKGTTGAIWFTSLVGAGLVLVATYLELAVFQSTAQLSTTIAVAAFAGLGSLMSRWQRARAAAEALRILRLLTALGLSASGSHYDGEVERIFTQLRLPLSWAQDRASDDPFRATQGWSAADRCAVLLDRCVKQQSYFDARAIREARDAGRHRVPQAVQNACTWIALLTGWLVAVTPPSLPGWVGPILGGGGAVALALAGAVPAFESSMWREKHTRLKTHYEEFAAELRVATSRFAQATKADPDQFDLEAPPVIHVFLREHRQWCKDIWGLPDNLLHFPWLAESENA